MSGSAIPASQIVSVVPSVLNAGGVGLELNGLLLMVTNTIPVGQVYSFPNLTAVQTFFGPTHYLSMLAGTYFLADLNSTKRPGALLMACMANTTFWPAWIRGGQLPTLTLAQLNAINPASTISLTMNGVLRTSLPINLSTATSFSDAAMKIGAAIKPLEGHYVTNATGSFVTVTGNFTVTAVATVPPYGAPNPIQVGDVLDAPGIHPGTYVTAQLSGTPGGVGVYSVNNRFALASQANIRVIRNPCVWDAATYRFVIQTGPWNTPHKSAVAGITNAPVTLPHLNSWANNLVEILKLAPQYGAINQPIGLGYAAGSYPLMGFAQQMDQILTITQNWASFTVAWEIDAVGTSTQRQNLAAWVNRMQNNYLYVCWECDAQPTAAANAPNSLGRILNTSLSSGTAPIYSPNVTNGRNLAMFTMGTIAAIDFNRLNGRKTLAFRQQTGITPDITNGGVAANLESNFYNYYGIWTTSNDLFRFLYPGYVSGPYKWIDSYINQIWMNNGFQLALMQLLTQTGSIPYNQSGYTMIKAACQDVINRAINFGAIRAGVTLSESQKIAVNNMAGTQVDGVLNTVGYYLQVLDANPQVRANRGTPPCTFFYMDGGSVQRITLASVMVQ